MKTKAPLIAVLSCMAISFAGAFTIDAVGYNGSTLTNTPLTINVPGYGDVVLQAVGAASLPVSAAYPTTGSPSWNFDQGEAITVTFNGLAPQDLEYAFVGVSVGENFVISENSPQSFQVTLQGSGGAGAGAGIRSMSWTVVPEPASAMLGLLGCVAFVLKRRR